eukprot:m.429803 g.429803  ORF g.429803 m.429803 type:complete len:51 (+) comp21387_c1_seq1:172-324(+)
MRMYDILQIGLFFYFCRRPGFSRLLQSSHTTPVQLWFGTAIIVDKPAKDF